MGGSMTNKQKKAMIERKKTEAKEIQNITANNKSVEPEKHSIPEDELQAILSGINFNIDNCTDQKSISDKMLYLANKEKEVLSEFKEKDMILTNGIYKELYDTIINVFGYYITELKSRLDLIIRSAKLHAAMKRLQFAVGEQKQDKIKNKFQIRILRYKNWLYFWQKLREHKIERSKAKLEHKAKIKELKKQLKEGVVMSP